MTDFFLERLCERIAGLSATVSLMGLMLSAVIFWSAVLIGWRIDELKKK